MTGRIPNTTRVTNLLWTYHMNGIPNFRLNPGGELWSTMPQHFKNEGFNVAGVGKVR